ncbi:hypothetical protein BH09MYX1_BH09MYX1_65240 [soil metagenome]
MADSKFALSRRGLLKGALALGGAALGARLGGRGWLPDAQAAGETSHLVFIYFPGGFNGAIGGSANAFVSGTKFGCTSTNIQMIGNGLSTDKATFGTLPAFALQHWRGVGAHHGVTSHTTPDNSNGGGERALTHRGTSSYLTQLAAAMGGDSALKAVHLGDYPAYRTQPSSGGVSLQRISDLASAIKALGAAGIDPNAPDRAIAGGGLQSAANASAPQLGANPRSLLSVDDAYKAGVATLLKPPPPPVTFPEISTAYGLGGSSAVSGFASQLAGAEVMIRAADSNVVSVFDNGFVGWDFHQVSGGVSQNMQFSRNRLLGVGGFDDRMTPLKTFMNRMLNLQDRNVVVAIMGDFVRVPNGDHGDGVVASVFGKYVKQGLSYGCDNNARFTAQTPGVDPLWSAIAAAVKCPGSPFGANPHGIV